MTDQRVSGPSAEKMKDMDMAPLLEVRDLRTSFMLSERNVRAVNGVSFSLRRGQTVGIVGESGSGKSVTALSLMRLVSGTTTTTSGSVIFEGQDLLKLSPREMRQLRGRRLAMIFQDPQTSLNPSMTIGKQIIEVLRQHRQLSRSEAQARALEMLESVGLSGGARRLRNYPHQLSGGMRQRVMIAIALACNPSLLIADEPTTALDVTIQAQVLALISDSISQSETSLLLITHDMGVVARMCDTVCVMYAGNIVEQGPVDTIFSAPRHPYTVGLLASVGRTDTDRKKRLTGIPGLPPDVAANISGCPFAPRCANALPQCLSARPHLTAADSVPEHDVACWNPVADATNWNPLGDTADKNPAGR